MSTGFPTLASADRNDRRAAVLCSESAATCSPWASHASAHRIPSPPALVTIATPSPFGGG